MAVKTLSALLIFRDNSSVEAGSIMCVKLFPTQNIASSLKLM